MPSEFFTNSHLRNYYTCATIKGERIYRTTEILFTEELDKTGGKTLRDEQSTFIRHTQDFPLNCRSSQTSKTLAFGG